MKAYMDYIASPPMDKRVLKAMMPYFKEKFGNASSHHSKGREARKGIEEARKIVADFVGAEPEEIIFTSGSTESDNLAIKSIAKANQNKGKHIITTPIEHDSVLKTCEYLGKNGFEITYLPVDRFGLVNPKELENAIRKDTILVAVMHANNEIGTIQPIEEIGKICLEKNVYFHSDGAQTAGKILIDVKKLGVTTFSIPSYKFYGPKGVGALYIKNGTKIETFLHGGGHEKGIRCGTENTPGIVGLGEACRIAKKEMREEEKRLTKMRDKLIKNILKIKNCWLNGHPEKRMPGNAHFCFKNIEGEGIVELLDEFGIQASTGSACSSKSLAPSHVLLAIGLKPEEAHGSLRLSFGRFTKEKEIDYVIETLPKVIEKLRKISPFKN